MPKLNHSRVSYLLEYNLQVSLKSQSTVHVRLLSPLHILIIIYFFIEKKETNYDFILYERFYLAPME